MLGITAFGQPPVVRSRWTTNVDGATINGNTVTNLQSDDIHAIYVSPTGNDATGQRGNRSLPFKTWYAWDGINPGVNVTGITQMATNGDTIYLLPGTYVQAWIPLNPNVNMVGIGNPTIIRSNINLGGVGQASANLSEMGPLVQPGHNSVITGITFVGTNTAFDGPVGEWGLVDSFDNWGLAQVTYATNWLFQNCTFIGTSDGYYNQTTSTNYGTFKQCAFVTGWDTTRTDGANVSSTFDHCSFSALFSNIYNSGNGAGRVFVPTGNSKIYDVGSACVFYGTNTGNTCGVSADSGASVFLDGTTFSATSAQTSNYLWFTNGGTGIIAGSYWLKANFTGSGNFVFVSLAATNNAAFANTGSLTNTNNITTSTLKVTDNAVGLTVGKLTVTNGVSFQTGAAPFALWQSDSTGSGTWTLSPKLSAFTATNGLITTFTYPAAGQTGAKTINQAAGDIRIAAAAGSVVLTDNLITANTRVFAQLSTSDTTAKSVTVSQGGIGSCTFTLNANATAEVQITWYLLNALQ